MPRLRNKLNVIKVPLDYTKKLHDQKFPRMPQMYLELLENKDKVKHELVNVDYKPPVISDGEIHDNKVSSMISDDESDYDVDLRRSRHRSRYRSRTRRRSPMKSKSRSKSRSRSPSRRRSRSPSRRRSRSPSRRRSRSPSRRRSPKTDLKDDNVLRRLKELISDSDSESDIIITPEEDEPRRNKRSSRLEKRNKRKKLAAPPLGELVKEGKVTIEKSIVNLTNPTISQMSDEDKLREYLFKFQILEKKYSGSSIPKHTMHSNLDQVKRSYDSSIRILTLDSNINNYKKYLIAGFAAIEGCLTWFGIDMKGYTQQQVISMNSYERLLIELGEKSYVPTGSRWGVEVRLIGLVIFNTALFVGSRIILKKSGFNIMGMVNSSKTQVGGSKVKKRKMKGPNVNLEDIQVVG